jgi:hypothetical protein
VTQGQRIAKLEAEVEALRGIVVKQAYRNLSLDAKLSLVHEQLVDIELDLEAMEQARPQGGKFSGLDGWLSPEDFG